MKKRIFMAVMAITAALVQLTSAAPVEAARKSSMPATKNPLVGTWKLVSFELRTDDGKTIFPWGKEVTGQVTYTDDGYMSGSFMKLNRKPFNSVDILGGTLAEFEAAMKSYVGYAGTYSINGDQVIHHASVSAFPNWTDTNIERHFVVEGDRLTLSTSPSTFGGQKASGVLIWQKLRRFVATSRM